METDNNAPSKLLPGEMVSENSLVKFKVNKLFSVIYVMRSQPGELRFVGRDQTRNIFISFSFFVGPNDIRPD